MRLCQRFDTTSYILVMYYITCKFEGGHNDCCTYYKGFTSDFLKIHIARKKAQEAATEK